MSQSLKETIESVECVDNCEIVEEQGIIEQIFVEASVSGSEKDRTQKIKAIVRSIVGAAALQHGLKLDYRKIKIVDYKKDEPADTGPPPRIRIAAAYLRRAPKLESVVELHFQEQVCIGTASVSDELGRSVFSAFAKAFAQTGLGRVNLVYLQNLAMEFQRERLIILRVELLRPDGSRDSLLGVAEIRDDLPTAVVKAALSAVNRRACIVQELPTQT